MQEYNITVKEVLEFVESIEYLREENYREYENIKNKVVDLLELQNLKSELIKNISSYNNLRFLKILNNMLNIAKEKDSE